MSISPPRFVAALPLLLALAFSVCPPTASAVPPVPGKHGAAGPKEGFSTARLRSDFAFQPGRGERISVESQGTYRVLAVRVAFSDTPIESSAAYYNRILFFMNQYWNQVSDGLVTLEPTLWDSVFTLPQPMAYYGEDDRFQERVVHMVRDMVSLADSTIDFRPYQSIVIFHAGQGQEADVLDNSHDQVWSAFITGEDFDTVLPDSTGAVGIMTNDLISPGNYYRVKEAVELPESESQDGYVFGMTGVTCHEFGHQLGLPDLYDTNADVNGYSQGLGAWDIMATGVWNANGFVPCGPSAWSRSFMNFVVPTRVVMDQSVTLSEVERAIGSSPRIVEIPVTQSEYFLIENRKQDLNDDGKFNFEDSGTPDSFEFYTDSYQGAEFDFFLPGAGTGSGLLIYHIDESKLASGLLLNIVNGDRDRKAVDLVEADGIQDLDDPPSGFNAGSPDDVFRAGSRDRWTPETTPSTEAYGDIRTGISVWNISAPDSLMTFDVSFDRLKRGWPVVIGGGVRNAGFPPLAVDWDGDGLVEVIVPVRRSDNSGAIYILEPDGSDFRDLDSNPATHDAFLSTATAITGSPCVGDIDGDGTPELVVETVSGTIYAIRPDGTEAADGDADPGTLGVLALRVGAGQPILVDLNGDGALEIVSGRPANPLGGSFLAAVRDSAGTVSSYFLPMGGATVGPPAAADLDGDGLPEVIVSNVITIPGELAANGLSIANWGIFTDPFLLTDPEEYPSYLIRSGGPYSPPVIADLNRDGTPEVIVADSIGSLHAIRVEIGSHILGDIPSQYVATSDLPGWPTATIAPGVLSEVSLGDLERDGYPEAFHTAGGCLVAGVHYSGSPRSGYPIAAGDPLAPADSTGFWPPLVADVDGDGVLDVLPVLPDGARPAFRADGRRVPGFGAWGSTGSGAPPVFMDLDRDGMLDWVEVYDEAPLTAESAGAPLDYPHVRIQALITNVPAAPGAVAWGQYRYGATRDGFFPSGPAGAPSGTSILSQVYAYPNPSHSGATFIHYRLSGPARAVRMKILDPVGQVVAEPPTSVADLLGSAEHSIAWNHAAQASGVYICRVEVESAGGTEVAFTKLAIVR